LLCLPDEDGILRHLSTVLINDDTWLRSRASNNNNNNSNNKNNNKSKGKSGSSSSGSSGGLLSGSGIKNAPLLYVCHPSISIMVAKQLNIHGISEVFIEELAFDAQNTPQINDNDTTYKNNITSRLQNANFVKGMSALLSMSAASSGSSSNSNSNGDTSKNTQQLLEGSELLIAKLANMDMRFVNGLPTRLSIKLDNNNDTQLSDTIEQSLFFFNGNAPNNRSFVYVNCNQLRGTITSELTISVCVCKLLGLDTSLAATVSVLLLCDDLLSNNTVTHTQALSSLQVGIDNVTLRERQRGLAGERLTYTDYHLLELKPFRVFRSGECIAYDIGLIEGQESDGQSNGGSMPIQEVLRYGRVITMVEEDSENNLIDTGMRKISVRINNEMTHTFLNTQVFSFKSARDAALSSNGGSSVSSSPSNSAKFMQHSALNVLPPPPPSGIDSHDKISATTTNDNSINQQDVVGAIKGLLLRAGIPTSLDQSDLYSRILELETANKRTEAELELERNQHYTTRQNASLLNNANKCQICVSNDFDHVFSPCGHPICGDCMTHLNRQNICPFCRANVQKKIKIFLPEVEEVD
jgi:hypothetical protein